MNALFVGAGIAALSALVLWLICGPKRAQGAKEETQTEPDTLPRNANSDSANVASTASNSPPPSGEKERARQKLRDCRECWSLGIEVLGLLGLSIYAYITYETWQGNIDALHVTERPWVSASRIEITNMTTPNAEGNFDVDVAISFKNSGASIAKEGATRVYLYPGHSGNSFELGSVPTTGVTSATLAVPFAGITGKVPISLGEIWETECKYADTQAANVPEHQSWETGFVLAPGATARYFEHVINNGVTPENLKTQHFMVFGCVSYRDGFNKRHHTRYCFIGRAQSDSDHNAKAKLVDCAIHESAD